MRLDAISDGLGGEKTLGVVADVPADFEDGGMVKDQVVVALRLRAQRLWPLFFLLFTTDMIASNVLEQSHDITVTTSS